MNLKLNLQKSHGVYSLPSLLLIFFSLTHSLAPAQQVKAPPAPTRKPPPLVECARPVPVPPGVRLNAQCLPYISNIKKLLDTCPTTDPAYAQIKKDFQIRRNGNVVIGINCTGSVSQLPLSKYTDVLIILQALRVIYYLDRGKPGQLPWTAGTFYDWLRSKVKGFNIDEKAVNPSCCNEFDGKLLMTLRTNDNLNKEYKKRWQGIAGGVALYAHERRHLDGFGHVSCPKGEQNDQDYDEKNISPFGTQWWLYKSWHTGSLNVGFSCLPADEQTETTNSFFKLLEQYRTLRFCGVAPPVIKRLGLSRTLPRPVYKPVWGADPDQQVSTLRANLRKPKLFREEKAMMRLLLLSASLFLLCGFIQPFIPAGSVAGQEQANPVRKPPTVVITSSMIDIDGDGQKERVEIQMPSGKRIAEEDLNCSPNYRGFQGKFSIVFQIAGKPVEQNLNPLFGEDEMTFRAERWVVRFADYNHDGRPDFNLGQYENCNGYLYRLFTVAPDGSVTPLKVKGYERGIYVSTFDNSTGQIRVNRAGFSVQSYNNDAEARCPGNCTTHFVWRQEKQMFVVERVVPVKE